MPEPIDQTQVFLTYMGFSGDVRQTAVALGLDVGMVQGYAAAGQWDKRLGELKEISAGKEPRDYKLATNRAVNYVQGHRLRNLVDRLLNELANKDGKELIDLLTTSGKNGSSFSTRPITDLVKAAEAAQSMTCRALGDNGGAGQADKEEAAGSDIALAVSRALHAAGQLHIPPAPLLRGK